MKNYISIITSVLLIFLVSCEEAAIKKSNAADKPSQQIDNASEDIKELIDVFGEKAKKFIDGEEMDKIKDIADELQSKGKEMLKDTAVWKAKLQEFAEDEEIKVLLEKYKAESGDVFKALEDLLESIEKN